MNSIMAMRKSALIHGHAKIVFILLINLDIIQTEVYSVLIVQFIIAIADGVNLARRGRTWTKIET